MPVHKTLGQEAARLIEYYRLKKIRHKESNSNGINTKLKVTSHTHT